MKGEHLMKHTQVQFTILKVDSFIVKDLDLRNKEIFLTKKDVDYYTQSLEINSTKIIKFLENKKRNDLNIFYGDLEVTSQVVGYQKRKPFTNDLIGEYPLELPSRVLKQRVSGFI